MLSKKRLQEMLLRGKDRPDVSVVDELVKRLNPEMIQGIHEYHQGNERLIRIWEKKLRSNIKGIQNILNKPNNDMTPPVKKWSKSMIAYWSECLLILAWMRRKDYYHATIGKST